MPKTGWCLSRDCDAAQGRGGCPVQTGGIEPCACPCHEGSVEAREFLPITPRFAGMQDPEDDGEPVQG